MGGGDPCGEESDHTMAKRSSWPGPLNAYQILYYTFKRNPYNRLFEPPIENIQKKETKMTANGPTS